jgi:transcriptional regulatory protein RtcR
MATLAAGGRITVDVVEEEITRLRQQWRTPSTSDGDSLLAPFLGPDGIEKLDPFDRVQLAEAVRTCQTSRTLSEAGRRLFAVSREQKEKPNDADRLRKYLARFGLDWQQLQPT